MKVKLKLVIADAFKEWLGTATKEQKQQLCNDGNALAIVLRQKEEKR